MIFITDSRSQRNLAKFSHLPWVYICGDGKKNPCDCIMDKDKRVFISKDIEMIVEGVRQNFTDFIGQVASQQDDKVLWYSSRVASRATAQSSVFDQYVYLKLLEKMLGEPGEDILVVSDDQEFLYNAELTFAGKVKFLKKRGLCLRRFYGNWQGYIKVMRYCVFWFLCRFFRNKRIGEFDVFIHSWVDKRIFKNPPLYSDAYFKELENILSKEGYRVGRLTPLRVKAIDILQLNKHFSNMVYPLAYVPLASFLKSAFRRFRVRIEDKKFSTVEDIEMLKILLKNEIHKENSTKIFLEYLLFFYAYKKISGMLKNNACLLYPFENLPWEKMFNLAFKDFKRIAYQHAAISYNWLNYHSSHYEQAPLPQIILTLGRKWTTFLRKRYSASYIEEGGALRYSHLFSKHKEDIQGRNIVLALPLSYSISIALQQMLLKVLREGGLSSYPIMIKAHPYLRKYACLKKELSAYKNCKFVDDDIDKLLKGCVLLVTSASTVAFEAVFSAIKTLYFIPEEISWGVERFIKNYLYIAYEENFSEKLREALVNPLRLCVNINDYFLPADYSAFLRHVNLKNVS